MPDIATTWDVDKAQGDWSLTSEAATLGTIIDSSGHTIVDDLSRPILDGLFTGGGGRQIVTGQDLSTAVIISLFTDATAAPDDAAPDNSGDPRGWWGGTIGSKLWLRRRAKKTPTLLATVKADIEDALAWLVVDGVASSVTATLEWRPPNLLGAQIVIARDAGGSVTLLYDWAWETI